MEVYDELANKFITYSDECVRFVVKHIPGQIIFGYTEKKEELIECLFYTNIFVSYSTFLEFIKDSLKFSNARGKYFSTIDVPEETILYETKTLGINLFPYSFLRHYEAIDNFNLFNNKQKLVKKEKFFCGSKYLKYTFGLEFETSSGFIPEDICFRDGLIPLRDGSISGLEYSTVVLSGNYGLSLLEQQLNSLKTYTSFNKECSLHIHFGSFPLNPDKIYRLYYICKKIEDDFKRLTPALTFKSNEYKATGKNYCKLLPNFRNFAQMYDALVGYPFFGDFTQPHPNDILRQAKWKVTTRYYFVNFINLLCYNVNKTIEFRFLRPTYNIKKILLWIYIFNAILKYAEESNEYIDSSISSIVNKVYPSKLSIKINKGIELLRILTFNQGINQDLIGANTSLEDSIFSDFIL